MCAMRDSLRRTQNDVTIGSTSVQLVGENMNRWALIISCPPGPAQPKSGASRVQTNAATTIPSILGAIVAGPGFGLRVTGWSWFLDSGTAPTITLEVIVGGTTITVMGGSTPGYFPIDLYLNAGDTIAVNCTAGGAVSAIDWGIFAEEDVIGTAVSLSFMGKASADKGLTLYPGGPPLVLMYDDFGQAVRESITAISPNGNAPVSVIDIFGANVHDPAGSSSWG